MKSRQIAAQNQRVERISTSTLVGGIDIAKEKHAAQATTFRGNVNQIFHSNNKSPRDRQLHIPPRRGPGQT